MPVVRAERKTTGLEALSKAMANALDSIQVIKDLKGQQMMEEAVLKAAAPLPNDTPESRYNRMLGAVQTTRTMAKPKGPFGVPILDKAVGMWRPSVPTFINRAPIMDLVTGTVSRDVQNQMALEAEQAMLKKGLGRYYESEADKILAQQRLQSERARQAYWQSRGQSIQGDVDKLTKRASETSDLLAIESKKTQPNQNLVNALKNQLNATISELDTIYRQSQDPYDYQTEQQVEFLKRATPTLTEGEIDTYRKMRRNLRNIQSAAPGMPWNAISSQYLAPNAEEQLGMQTGVEQMNRSQPGFVSPSIIPENLDVGGLNFPVIGTGNGAGISRQESPATPFRYVSPAGMGGFSPMLGTGMDMPISESVDAITGMALPITATNSETGEELVSFDGGRSWQILQ